MGTRYIDLEKKNIGMQQHVKEKYESRRVNHHRKEKSAGFELKSAKNMCYTFICKQKEAPTLHFEWPRMWDNIK